ncbi:hypothetical protein [Geobacter sp. DSM 9736]|uniref:hypothetical protein n=1 Tax=Geobacter sp. DSM 9736 TaxID=1277350 RepID=UPI000B50EDF2|nr:hypothetical protein [Geobacter sp. DSM 9736]SNB47252.1 hypothetical protein SAMN06269301_2730 [Geobacter sp. DSM 9736]
MKTCHICKKEFSEDSSGSVFVEAGEWLSEELWLDAGELCQQCLENRAKLAMMYLHEYNT